MKTVVVMNKSKTVYMCLGLAVVASIATWAFGRWLMPRESIGVPEIVDSIRIDDSVKVVLTQTFTGTLEPYRVTLWYCDHEGTWRGYYVDHEALRWRGAFEVTEHDFVVFREGDRVLLKFDTKEKVLYGPGSRRSAVPIRESKDVPWKSTEKVGTD